jgi:tetratricopeptide (TPR) repeat protein
VREEIDNVQRAWRWAASRGNSVLLAQGLQSLCRFYLWDGRLADGRDTCRLAANGLSMQPANQVADGGRSFALWSQVLAWETEFVEDIAYYKEELLSQSQQLLDMATADGRDMRAEQAFIFIANAYTAQNRNYDEALKFVGLGLKIFRELEDRGAEAEALWIMGVLSLFHGEHDRAGNLLRDSLDLSQQLEDTMGTARALGYLSHVARNQGNFAEAEALQRERLKLHRLLGNRYEEWSALGALSILLI